MVKNISRGKSRPHSEVVGLKQKISERLEEFRGLGLNWDGDNAVQVDPSTLVFAQKVAYALIEKNIVIDFCVPLRNGGIQFEFKQRGECEIEVQPDQTIHFLWYDDQSNMLGKEQIAFDQLINHGPRRVPHHP